MAIQLLFCRLVLLSATFLCSFHQAFYSGILLTLKWCSHTIILTWLKHGRIPIYANYILIKQEFFQALTMSVLSYGYTTLTLTKCLNKNLDGKYTRMLYLEVNNNSKTYKLSSSSRYANSMDSFVSISSLSLSDITQAKSSRKHPKLMNVSFCRSTNTGVSMDRSL